MSSSNHYMAPSSSTDPMYQQINQPDTQVQFHEQPVSQNTYNRSMAPEARHTYHHHNPPIAPQDPFQAQNLQQHQWNQEKNFQHIDNVHGNSQPQNLQWNQENCHHHDFMRMNHQNHQSSSSHFHNQRNMTLDLQNHQNPQNPHGAPKNHGIPDSYMNHDMFYQSAPDAARNFFNPDFMNTNNQFMYPPMSQQHTHGTPGPSYFQGIPNNFQFGHMDQKNTPNQFMNKMPPQLPLGVHGTPNYFAFPQQNNGFAAPGQNPIVFNLLNAATWKFLSTFPNEMMVTNDGRSIFPRFEIGIMNLIPKANYNVGIKLQLVNPQKHTYHAKEKKWREVDRRKSEDLAEQETNEVYSEVQSGQDIMDNGLKMKLVNIYTIGNEKKKTSATSGPMTEERMRMMEHKKKIRAQKMIRVFSQQKYVPIFTLYQQMDFGTPQPILTTQFPDTEFITTTGYRNETLKNWKRKNNEFVRGDLRTLDI